jgi:hypothetical protein
VLWYGREVELNREVEVLMEVLKGGKGICTVGGDVWLNVPELMIGRKVVFVMLEGREYRWMRKNVYFNNLEARLDVYDGS